VNLGFVGPVISQQWQYVQNVGLQNYQLQLTRSGKCGLFDGVALGGIIFSHFLIFFNFYEGGT